MPDDRTDEIVIPALMRAARGSYAAAIAERLEAAGIDDLPRHGPFVLGGMANHGGSAADMIGGLGISKQRASQLVDTLVLRGYLTREVNADDRRRTTILLTDRGRAAAAKSAPRSIRSTPNWPRCCRRPNWPGCARVCSRCRRSVSGTPPAAPTEPGRRRVQTGSAGGRVARRRSDRQRRHRRRQRRAQHAQHRFGDLGVSALSDPGGEVDRRRRSGGRSARPGPPAAGPRSPAGRRRGRPGPR